jgi:uncharacterized protein YllA (UPF0747 family)
VTIPAMLAATWAWTGHAIARVTRRAAKRHRRADVFVRTLASTLAKESAVNLDSRIERIIEASGGIR